MFERVSTEKLKEVADVLKDLYPDKPDEVKVCQFARTVSVMARCELARRLRAEEH